jgi:ATP-independent RNA helicase DbpA
MKVTIQEKLRKIGIETLKPMQKECMKQWTKFDDLLLLSPTGSGKTLAFLLPTLKNIDPNKTKTQALILSPARELALQIESVAKSINSNLKINCCYGGHSMQTEKNNLKNTPHIIIGTPGRIADHFRRENISSQEINTLILDEFDKALDLGFSNEMKQIIEKLKPSCKKVLTSATNLIELPDFIQLKNHGTLNYITDQKSEQLQQYKVVAKDQDKLAILLQLICEKKNDASLIFCNHRDAVERIADLLKKEGICCDIFHGGLEQNDRERALIKFRNGSHHILITTDLAARGLDIPEIKNVIHYQLPKTEDAFIHRNGRTARMHAKGNSILVFAKDEKIPDFISSPINEIKLSEKLEIPNSPEWETLYISMGKKEKINKIDLVGFFFKKGNLQKDELGKIDVLDHHSFVAVKRGLSKNLLRNLKNERIKKKKIRINISL